MSYPLRNIRNIVLMRPIRTMIEFKQIIGRGTRLFDGKEYFTIYDFVKAYEHFSDPEWDGEQADPIIAEPRGGPPPDGPPDGEEYPERGPRAEKVRVKLADGKERTIQHMIATSFWSPDGTPISSAQFLEKLFGDIPDLFSNEDQLRELWSQPDTRRKLLDELEEKGYGQDQLTELTRLIDAQNSDLYDVLAYVAFSQPPVTREERVEPRRHLIYGGLDDTQREFLDFVLGHYIRQGVRELDTEKLPQLLELKYHAVTDAVAELGSTANIRTVFVDFQRHLYSAETAA